MVTVLSTKDDIHPIIVKLIENPCILSYMFIISVINSKIVATGLSSMLALILYCTFVSIQCPLFKLTNIVMVDGVMPWDI